MWYFYVLCVTSFVVLVLGLVAMCGGMRIPACGCLESKWFVWFGALLQLGVFGVMLCAMINNSWTVAVVPGNKYLNFGLTSAYETRGNGVGEHAPPSGARSLGSLCNPLLSLDSEQSVREMCLTVSIGVIAMLLFGLLFLLAALVVAILAIVAMCGKRIHSPNRSSILQFILGIGVVMVWLCVNKALNDMVLMYEFVPNDGIPFHSWSFGNSWLMALGATAVSLPLMVLFAQPEIPETVLYQVFRSVKEEEP